MRRYDGTDGRLILMAPIYGETSARLHKRERRGAPFASITRTFFNAPADSGFPPPFGPATLYRA